MSVIYTEPASNRDQKNSPNFMAYDLQSEKNRIAEATEVIKKNLLEGWKKRYADAKIFSDRFSNVNPELIDSLLAFQNTLAYNEIAKKFNISSEQRDILPRIVWGNVLNGGAVSLEKEIEEKMKVGNDIALQISDEVNRIILSKARELSRRSFSKKTVSAEAQIKKVEIPLAQALKRYRKLGDQLVTNSRIKIRIFPEPARPSIKNWIDDYYENIGAGEHGSVERGNFLFHGFNTKNLSAAERQKLGSILKSLDENSPLKINTEREEVVFDQMESGTGNRPSNSANSEFRIQKKEENGNSQRPNPGFGNMKFSSPQKLSSESQKRPGYTTPAGMGSANQRRDINQAFANQRTKGNIVDLRNS